MRAGRKIWLWYGWALLLVIALSGCIAVNPLPIAARAGDTITLAVGSPDGIKKANTTVSYQPDAGGSPIDLTANVTSVFKLYPDPTSPLVAGGASNYWDLLDSSGHVPWISVVSINLPTTMPVGTGEIHVNTPAVYPTDSMSVNSASIAFEVLPGTGAPHPLAYLIGTSGTTTNIGNLTGLQSAHQVVVRPKFPSSMTWPTYGAIQLKLRFVDGAPPANGYQFVAEDATEYTGSARNISYSDSGDQLLVMYTSAYGLLSYYEPRFSIVPIPVRANTAPPPPTMPTAPPILLSVDYYDVDGNAVSGPPTTDYTITLE
jgi:hypothetical protein